MPFQPRPYDTLTIDGASYRVSPHPAAPGIAYGQEGRAAIVYQVAAGQELRALKVFRPSFRLPSLAGLARQMETYPPIRGLRVLRRTALVPQHHGELLRVYPDLTYALLMPWIDGPTWLEVMSEQRALSAEQSLALAHALVELLAEMEQLRLAHCDLSSANLILPALAGTGQTAQAVQHPLELVDVEQMYSPRFDPPEKRPGGSPGYAYPATLAGAWSGDADRFAGAILLAELLGWCDEKVRGAAWGESYFQPEELGLAPSRYGTLRTVLEGRWGRPVVRLFERAWRSQSPSACPTFGEWSVVLPRYVDEPARDRSAKRPSGPAARALLGLGRDFEASGDTRAARMAYLAANEVAPRQSEEEAASTAALTRLQATASAANDGRQVAAPAGNPASRPAHAIAPPPPSVVPLARAPETSSQVGTAQQVVANVPPLRLSPAAPIQPALRVARQPRPAVPIPPPQRLDLRHWLLAATAGFLASTAASYLFLDNILANGFMLIAAAFINGALQRNALKDVAQVSPYWLLWTVAGSVPLLLLASALFGNSSYHDSPVSLATALLFGLVAGLLAGVPQALLLMNTYVVDRPGWWLAGSIVATVVATCIWMPGWGFAGLIIAAPVYAAVTGMALYRSTEPTTGP